MNENTTQGLVVPAVTSRDVLTGILLDGAQRLLGQAIEAEVEGWLESHKHLLDSNGHHRDTLDRHLAEGLRSLEHAIIGGQAVCVRLG